MKKNYNTPDLRIKAFNSESIITASDITNADYIKSTMTADGEKSSIKEVSISEMQFTL